jgi:L-iditol 2-dehydrogenase
MGFNLDGGFAETLALPQECLPRGLNLLPRVSDPGLLALAEPLACCLNGQESTGVFEGERVLILGGGPIGSLHASLARWNGADKILMSEKIEERRRRIRGVADRVINPLEESLEDVVLEETGSEGVDVIFTATPEIHVGNSLLSLLAPGGRVCIFSGPKPDNYQEPFDIRSVHYREWTVTGSYGCSSRHDKRAVELLLSGSLNLDWLITLRAPLERIQEAFNHARERKGMKSLIKFS